MERAMHHPEHFPQPSPTPSLEYSHHRGRQSFDHGRQGAFRHQDPQAGWAPRSRGGSGSSMRYMWSSSHGLPHPPPSQPSSSSSKNWTGQITCPNPSPSPSETELLHSWASSQSSSRHGYYLDRGNGMVTRLVPADMLPELNEVPRKERRVPGMEVLQPFYGAQPPGMADMNQSFTIKETPLSSVQHSKMGKHDKEYCDKWVHEGICAFTQQGCRYRHEMPLDKVTQHSLGLFHGFPSWWKKRQADLARQQDGGKSAAKRHTLPMAPSAQSAQDASMLTSLSMMPVDAKDALAGSVPDTPWRRGAIPEGPEGKTSGRRGEAGPPPCSYRYPFGAIQPPRSRRSQ